MDLTEQLTNEELKQRFSSDFELVNYAIKIAAYMIRAGKEPAAQSEVRNFAYRILQCIVDGQEEFVELDKEEVPSDVQAAKEAILKRVAETKAQMAAATE